MHGGRSAGVVEEVVKKEVDVRVKAGTGIGASGCSIAQKPVIEAMKKRICS